MTNAKECQLLATCRLKSYSNDFDLDSDANSHEDSYRINRIDLFQQFDSLLRGVAKRYVTILSFLSLL